jgi:hypothetical protein
MAESKLYTFMNLFGSKFKSKDYDDPDGVKLTEIEIPIIQRDYAQGRKSNEVGKVRRDFLGALYDGLMDCQPISLDFVYGDVTSHGKMIPLDGQQRLTTLFLLHWYIAKRENIEEQQYEFLNHFTYETRDSARQFFHELVAYNPDFSSNSLSDDIEDQNWFPYEWKKDPTIVSALVMIDAIHKKFGPAIEKIKAESNGEDSLWKRLKEGMISFYFLPIHEMGLTDDLYIKMNSRGKPLTLFEHFKAALERQLKKYDKETAVRIIKKIDLQWTDMLWPYRGSNNIIDDEFMAYFAFISNVIYYKAGQKPEADPFTVIEELFNVNNPDVDNNIIYFEKMFDIWCSIGDITSFFKDIYTKDEHESGKITVFFPINNVRGEVNPFLECCWNFGVLNGLGNRTFTLSKFLWLYSVTDWLRNKDVISRDDAIRRLRVINNLINASEFEIRADKMPSILAQTDKIMLDGEIDQEMVSYSKLQMKEEQDKLDFLALNPDEAELVYKLEDHPLLRGTISVIGLSHLDLSEKFYELFNDSIDRQLINCALLTIGDYSQLFRWRYQLGSRVDNSWMNLFHPSNERVGFSNTNRILCQLLTDLNDINNEALQKLVDSYLQKATIFDWRYYMVKYPQMRTEPYGMFYWWNYKNSGNQRYDFIIMHTEKSIGGKNWYAFLKVLYELCSEATDDLYLADYAYSGEGKYLYLTTSAHKYKISVTQTGFEVENDNDNEVRKFDVPQNSVGLDIEDRVVIGKRLIEELRTADK